MTESEIVQYIMHKQTDTGMTDPTKKNQFMGLVMKDLRGKADSMLVKKVIDTLFA